MDIDQAHTQGLCFKCSKCSHISRKCPDNPNRQDPAQARAFVQDLNDEECNVLLRELGVGEPQEGAEGF